MSIVIGLFVLAILLLTVILSAFYLFKNKASLLKRPLSSPISFILLTLNLTIPIGWILFFDSFKNNIHSSEGSAMGVIVIMHFLFTSLCIIDLVFLSCYKINKP